MTREFEEFHDELRSVAGDLLAKDRTVDWSVLVDAGWAGLEVPDHLGGAGATFAEVAIVCEEIGRAASTNSYLGSAVLTVGALKALQPSDTRDGLLSDVASGAVRLAVALEPLDFVPDAGGADRVLVVTDAGIAEASVTVAPQPVVDETRRLAIVTADGVEGSEVLRFAGDAESAIRRLRERAAVAVACDSLGISEAMLAATVVVCEGAPPVRQGHRLVPGGEARVRGYAGGDRGVPPAGRRRSRSRRRGSARCWRGRRNGQVLRLQRRRRHRG